MALLRKAAPGSADPANGQSVVANPFLPLEARTIYRHFSPLSSATAASATFASAANTAAVQADVILGATVTPTAPTQQPLVIEGRDLKDEVVTGTDAANCGVGATNVAAAGTREACPAVVAWLKESASACAVTDIFEDNAAAGRTVAAGAANFPKYRLKNSGDGIGTYECDMVAGGTAGRISTDLTNGNNGCRAAGATVQLLGNRFNDLATNTIAGLAKAGSSSTDSIRAFYFRDVNTQKLRMNYDSSLKLCLATWDQATTSYNAITTMMNVQIRPRCDADAGSQSTTHSDTALDFGLFHNSCAKQMTSSLDTVLAWQVSNSRKTLSFTNAAGNEVAPNSAGGITPNTNAPAGVYNDQLLFSHFVAANSLETSSSATGLVRYYDRRGRTQCCGWRDAITSAAASGNNYAKRFGVCINPTFESCCSAREDQRALSGNGDTNGRGGIGKPYNKFTTKCCFGGDSGGASGELNSDRASQVTAPVQTELRFLDDACPCKNERETDYCGATKKCCTQTKYPELMPSGTDNNVPKTMGLCYEPRSEKCCDTGSVYNPTIYQCCAVTGLQLLANRCPCSMNSHCGGNQTCCMQQFPNTYSAAMASCNTYLNYPTGQRSLAAADQNNIREYSQYCPGTCIDTRFQTCCNGQACQGNFQKCCNNTCCDTFTSSCQMGYNDPMTRDNNANFRVPFEKCTGIEALTPPRAVMVYFVPLLLVLASLLGLAFSLFFAKRVNALLPISSYERVVLAFCTGVIVFAWPVLFSPVWKYGIVIMWVSFFTILAALAGSQRLLLGAIVAQALLLVFLVDPFDGNEALMFPFYRSTNAFNTDPEHSLSTFNRQVGGDYNEQFNGMLPTINALWTKNSLCTVSYFGFFERDDAMEDARFQNPEYETFGYCSRDWIGALLVLMCIDLVLVILLMFATIITHVKNVLVKKVVATGVPYDMDQ